MKLHKWLKKEYLLYIAWFQAWIAMVGSLFFSEILKLPPCSLCWYQRIFMYPLVFILAVGILRKDKNLPYYVLPLSLTGGLIAIYHNLLYYGLLPESVAPCSLGVSCTTKLIEFGGFVTIPFLSLFSFILISLAVYLYLKFPANKPRSDHPAHHKNQRRS